MSQTLSVEEIRQRIARAVESEKAQFIADTAQVMRFETVSGGDEAAMKKYHEQTPLCLAFIESVAKRMGFTWRNIENRSAEISWEGKSASGAHRPVIGIAAHIDVVPAMGEWKHGPFAGEVSDDIIWGRGTQDDKGPLMQSLYGLYAVKKAGIELPVDVRIIVGTCEETGDWDDIAEYIQKRGAPDFAWTPDADFPLTIGEKGMINVEFLASWAKPAPDMATGVEFISAAGGSRPNIVIDKCEVRLKHDAAKKSEVTRELMRATTEFTVQNPGANITLLPEGESAILATFLGKAAHGSTPAQGHNAALDALAFFSDIATLPRAVRAFVQFLSFVGRETDGANLMITSDHPFIGATTVNLGVLDINSKGGRGILNIRPTLGLTVVQVLEAARTAAQAFGDTTGLEITVRQDGKALDAIYVDPQAPKVAPYLQAMQTAYTAVTGRAAEMQSIGGTTYSKAFPVCCAFGPNIPGDDPELAHQADEHVTIATLMRNAMIYGTTLALMK